MSKDLRMEAVFAGCLTYFVSGMVLFIGGLVFVVLYLKPDGPEDFEKWVDSQGLLLVLLMATAVVGLVAGLVTGFKAKGREILHVLALMAFSVGFCLLVQLLPGSEPDPDVAITDPGLFWGLAGFVSGWAPPFCGALIARTIRLKRESKLLQQGLRACERCEYPMEIEALVCPRCGQVV